MEIWLVSAVLVAALILLITEWVPVAVTAMGIIVALVLTGLLPAQEAVKGFASPAVITVGAMFAVSRGLTRTGAVGFIGQRLLHMAKGKPLRAMLLVLFTVGCASAFINNTPVVVLFIPVVIGLSCELSTSPSKLLIPISYASILAGTCTLIGTSTNIIISDLGAASGMAPLSMFELAPVGIPIALVGITFLIFAAPRMLPGLQAPICEIGNGEHRRYLAEVIIPRGSKLLGRDPANIFSRRFPDMEIFELIRYDHIYYPGRDHVNIAADDMLLVKGSANDLVALLHENELALPMSENGVTFGTEKNEAIVLELIIPPQSSLVGARLLESRLLREPDIHIMAIKRSHLHYTEKKIQDVRLRAGDILLVRGEAERLERLRGRADYILVEDVHHEIVHTRRALRAALIFGTMVLAATTGLADIMTCSLAGVVMMVASGCLQIRDAYRALQMDVLLLIAGTIGLGAAMQASGASDTYARFFLGLLEGRPPTVILGGIMLLTSISTQLLSNNATAVLLLPIAVSTAHGLGVDPRPFVIAVCLGASACFATPIGYQTNLLVYGPGGYRFADYLKMGIPMNLIVLVMGTIMIPMIWPL